MARLFHTLTLQRLDQLSEYALRTLRALGKIPWDVQYDNEVRILALLSPGCSSPQPVNRLMYRGASRITEEQWSSICKDGIAAFDDRSIAQSYFSGGIRVPTTPSPIPIPPHLSTTVTWNGTQAFTGVEVNVVGGLISGGGSERPTTRNIVLNVPSVWGAGYAVGVGCTTALTMAMCFPPPPTTDRNPFPHETSVLVFALNPNSPLFLTYEHYKNQIVQYVKLLSSASELWAQGAANAAAAIDIDSALFMPDTVNPVIDMNDAVKAAVIASCGHPGNPQIWDKAKLALALLMIASKECALPFIPPQEILGRIDVVKERTIGGNGYAVRPVRHVLNTKAIHGTLNQLLVVRDRIATWHASRKYHFDAGGFARYAG